MTRILTFTGDKGEIVQSIQLKTHVGEDGLLKVQMPPEIKDMELDVMVVFQPLSNEEQIRCNAWGKPLVTLDEQLAKAATSCSIPLFNPEAAR